jgi:hypothetical protein
MPDHRPSTIGDFSQTNEKSCQIPQILDHHPSVMDDPLLTHETFTNL